MIGIIHGTNLMHSVMSARVEMSLEYSHASCASLWALEADVTLRNVMSVEYFTNPSMASLSVIVGTCTMPWRRGIHSDSNRAVLPLSCQKTPRVVWVFAPGGRVVGAAGDAYGLA